MLRSLINRWFSPRRTIRRRKSDQVVLGLTGLETRLTPAVSATFFNGLLSVLGDDLDNTITISRDAAGAILVNSGAVRIRGGTPTVANTALIQAFGSKGFDTLTLDETS